ncbi:hypothetical protein LCGC14_1545410 [marine sediment metagenome]|uniref:DOD-type homing endonuclease domain-containing protein n=1 Tax=marine sediment metagenome TaxID=412755 RepID=A0A0F9JCP2_9ZZZZ
MAYSKKTHTLLKRGKKAAKEFREFVRFIAGFDPAPHEDEWIEACQLIGDEPRAGHKFIVIAPPGSGKTTIMVLFVAWMIGKYPEDHVGLLSYADKVAWARSSAIRKIITDSKPYHFTFPNIRRDPQNWGSAEFRVKRKNIISPHPTLRAGGTKSAVVAYRLGGLVLDDAIDQKQAANAEQRDKAFTNYENAILTRLIDKAWEFCVGTRWTADDFIGRLIKRKRENWKVIHIPALDRYGKTYWPPDGKGNGYSQKFMDDKKFESPELFAIQYMGDTKGGESQIIRKLATYDEVPGKELIEEKDLLVAVGIDSVAGNEPVTVRFRGYPLVISFDELWEMYGTEITYSNGREVRGTPDLEVLGRRTWTSVEFISRHYYQGTMKILSARTGRITITPNHSLIDCKGRKIKPDELAFRQNLPAPPWSSVPHRNKVRPSPYKHQLPDKLFVGPLELAWACGLFVAEGCVVKPSRSRQVEISNKNIWLLLRAEQAIAHAFRVKVILTKPDVSGVQKLVVNDDPAGEYFERFGHLANGKRITDDIFGAPNDVRLAFFEGYMAGDGTYIKKTGLPNITTASSILAQQLAVMVNELFGYRPKFYWRRDKQHIKNLAFVRTKQDTISNIIQDISYDGYVYDLTTSAHVFRAGLGGILVSNSAYKEKEKNDFSVCYVGGLDSYGRIWILDRRKGRFSTPQLMDEIYDIQEEWEPFTQWIEDGGGGTPAVQTIQAESPDVPLEAVTPSQGGKRSRVHALSPYIHRGQIIFPKMAAWLEDAKYHLTHFPYTGFDDDPDALWTLVSQLLDVPHPSAYDRRRDARGVRMR